VKTASFADKIDLWGVDHPSAYPEMLLDFIETLAQNQPRPAPAQSLEELKARQVPLQMRLRHSLGLDPWPERTPLNASLVGKLERPGYMIEKWVYEAWAGLPVTAHLYIPQNLDGPAPALIYACGHWMEAGKLALPVQSFCAAAAMQGIITLVYDPIGQGERLESWRDHGNLNALLLGRCQLGWMVWESMRALDFLLSRPEVNSKRIGMTGASGGGLNTFFTTAVDDRFACAIPAAYPCTFFAAMRAERDLNWEDGTDACNQIPGVMSYAEMSDIASLFIPKPYMILSGRQDKIFPIAAARQVAAKVLHNYQLAGIADHFRFVEFDEDHGYQASLRQAAYGWLKYWLCSEGDGSPILEPALDLLPDPYPVGYMAPPMPAPGNLRAQSPTSSPTPGSLQGFCLPAGQSVPCGTIIHARIREIAAGLPEGPSVLAGASNLSVWQEAVKLQIRDLLGPFPPRGSIRPRLFNQVWEDGLMAERITFESEAGITLPGLFIMPEEWKIPAPFVIYAGEWGKKQGIHSGVIEELLRAGYGVLAIDVRGVGETAASDFEAGTNCLMMNRSLFGQRVFDIMRAVDFLWERCYIAPQIDKGRLAIVGEGVGGLWGLHAAALDGRVAAVVAEKTLFSYRALLEPGARFPASVYIFDMLRHYDLVHVIGACAPRPVYLHPVDGLRKECSQGDALPALKPAMEAFLHYNVPANYLMVAAGDDEKGISGWLDEVLHRGKE
jgi:cephalosporin-C deacetylase-like acetyl esterase